MNKISLLQCIDNKYNNLIKPVAEYLSNEKPLNLYKIELTDVFELSFYSISTGDRIFSLNFYSSFLSTEYLKLVTSKDEVDHSGNDRFYTELDAVSIPVYVDRNYHIPNSIYVKRYEKNDGLLEIELIRYLADSIINKNNFFNYFHKQTQKYLFNAVEIHLNSIDNYFSEMGIKNLSKLSRDLFKKPDLLIYKQLVNVYGSSFGNPGSDSGIVTHYDYHITTYQLLKLIEPIDDEFFIIEYLDSIKKTVDNSYRDGGAYSSKTSITTRQIDVNLTRAILLHKSNDYSDLDITKYSSKLTKEKIIFILFVLFCDYKRILKKASSINYYLHFNFINLYESLITSSEYSIYDFELNNKYCDSNFNNLHSKIFEYIMPYVSSIFGEKWLNKLVIFFLLNPNRLSNEVYIKHLYTFGNSTMKLNKIFDVDIS